jgi:Holliday junction resolvase RusA-like endonuclease
MKLFIRGHISTKKNGKMAWGGKVVTTRISKQELDALILQVKSQWKAEPLEYTKHLRVTFHVRDGRGDLDGKYTTLQDVLVKAGVLKNDSIARVNAYSVLAHVDPNVEEGATVEVW